MATVDSIYRRLTDEDHVDLVIGGYGTGTLLAAMPAIIERERFFVGLMGLGVNERFGHPNYFAMIPTVPEPGKALSEGFFALAAAQAPAPSRVALVSADEELSRTPVQGARANAARHGFRIGHESTYPPGTATFAPIINAVAGSDIEILFLCSGAADSIGLVRAMHAQRFRPKMVGGAMTGPQESWVRTTLGPLLNGFVIYEYWAPVPKMIFPGVGRLLHAYQAKAAETGAEPQGYHVAPLAYAQMQVVAQAVEAIGAIDDTILSTFASEATFHTVMGDLRFGRNGEWAQPRVLQVQLRGIDGHDAEQFRDGSRQMVVSPGEWATGPLIYPYAEALGARPQSRRFPPLR